MSCHTCLASVMLCIRCMLVIATCMIMAIHSEAAENQERIPELEAGFLQPPRAAKPSAYWLWLNGYTNRDYFEQELKDFADHGIGGLCIFDMGARGDARFFPPTGAAFMSEASVESIARAVETAKRCGLDVQIAACSSWDLGGSWVTPEHASMALYRTETRVEGPQDLDVTLPFPDLPPAIPRQSDGTPVFFQDVAVLAVPETKRLAGHEFIFRLPRDDIHRLDHVILYNADADQPEKYGELQRFAKDFLDCRQYR